MKISLIAAIANNNVIGKNNDLLWRLPADMKYFKDLTVTHHVLMGRKTYESIPEKYKPLPNRTNLIITRKKVYSAPDCHVFNSIKKAVRFAENGGEKELFVIGGGTIYKHTIDHADHLYITKVDHEFEGDTFFPEINLLHWKEVKRIDHCADEKHAHNFSFIVYNRIQKN